jgi:hypothetical protein
MTIVPPSPQEAIADVMAGTSSIDDDPPAVGVHVEARAFRVLLASGRASDRAIGSVAMKLRERRSLDIVKDLRRKSFRLWIDSMVKTYIFK